MKIITYNVNGIRAAARKGFYQWLSTQDADVVCLQEVRADDAVLAAEEFQPEGYYCYYKTAEKKGYSGVGIYTKVEPDQIISELGFVGCDDEGRYLQIDLGDMSIASLYLPSGSSGDHRQQKKYEFLDNYLEILKQQMQSGRHFIITGDFNIVHKEIDIKNWKSNQKTSGVLPEERAWLDTIFDEVGFVDAFRVVNQEPGQYTWWSNRGRARENNVGWRIDYQITTPGLKGLIQSANIYKDEWYSDHAPLIMEYDVADL